MKVVISILPIAMVVIGPVAASADVALETAQLVEKAKFAVENLAADPNMGPFRDLAKRAKGIFIAPQLLKAAFRGRRVGRERRAGCPR